MDSGTVNGLPDLSLFDTFPKLLQRNARNHPDEVALREKEFGIWRSLTWGEYQTRVKTFALGLRHFGIGARRCGRADRRQPAGLGLGEIAAHAVGAMSLGIYRDALDDEVAFLIDLQRRPRDASRRTRSRSTSCSALGDRMPDRSAHRLQRPARHAEARRSAADVGDRAGAHGEAVASEDPAAL